MEKIIDGVELLVKNGIQYLFINNKEVFSNIKEFKSKNTFKDITYLNLIVQNRNLIIIIDKSLNYTVTEDIQLYFKVRTKIDPEDTQFVFILNVLNECKVIDVLNKGNVVLNLPIPYSSLDELCLIGKDLFYLDTKNYKGAFLYQNNKSLFKDVIKMFRNFNRDFLNFVDVPESLYLVNLKDYSAVLDSENVKIYIINSDSFKLNSIKMNNKLFLQIYDSNADLFTLFNIEDFVIKFDKCKTIYVDGNELVVEKNDGTDTEVYSLSTGKLLYQEKDLIYCSKLTLENSESVFINFYKNNRVKVLNLDKSQKSDFYSLFNGDSLVKASLKELMVKDKNGVYCTHWETEQFFLKGDYIFLPSLKDFRPMAISCVKQKLSVIDIEKETDFFTKKFKGKFKSSDLRLFLNFNLAQFFFSFETIKDIVASMKNQGDYNIGYEDAYCGILRSIIENQLFNPKQIKELVNIFNIRKPSTDFRRSTLRKINIHSKSVLKKFNITDFDLLSSNIKLFDVWE